MPAIPVDGDAAITLQGARAEARQALKEAGIGPSSSPLAGAKAAPGGMPGAPQFDQPPPPSDEVTSVDNTSDVLGAPEQTAAAPPPPKPAEVKEDNGEVSFSSAAHFLRDAFKGTPEEVGNAIPRALARVGGWLVNAGAGAVFAGEKLFGSQKHYEDAIFDWKKQNIDSAVDYWTPKQAAATGEGEGSGAAAQAIGRGAEVIPGLLTGGAGMLAQVLQGSTDSAMNDVDQGKSVSHAIADGTLDGIAQWVGMKFGIKPGPSILKRIITAIPANDIIHMAGNVLKAGLNHVYGDNKGDSPSIFEGLDEATVQGAIFGALAGKGHTTLVDKSAPNTGTPSDNTTSPPSPTPEVTAAPATAASATAPASAAPTAQGAPAPAAPSAVPDKPSVEPLKDVQAQWADMNSKITPRTGVLITPETKTHIESQGFKGVEQAKAQGRTVDFPQGTLVLKTKADVIKVNQRIKAGEDPQRIIGTVTGAGTGKTADATAVVQGRDANGAVAAETTVHPDDVPMAVQKMEDQGKTPVVTTAEEAVSRRVAEREKEVQAAPAAESTVEAKPVSEPVAKTEAPPEHESEEPAEPAPRMGIFTAANGNRVPVHIEEGAPEGMLRLRPIDPKTGEPAERTIDAPAKNVRESTQGEDGSGEATGRPGAKELPVTERVGRTEPTSPSVPAKEAEVQDEPEVEAKAQPQKEAPREEPAPTPAPALNRKTDTLEGEQTSNLPPVLKSLKDSLTEHENQEGGERPSLTDRQDNASSFAAVLKDTAAKLVGKAPVSALERAVKAAKAAANLTYKSKEDTARGRGTSHSRIDAINTEMHEAARELLGEEKQAATEPVVAPKAAALKARIAKKKAAPETSATEAAKPTKFQMSKADREKAAGMKPSEQAAFRAAKAAEHAKVATKPVEERKLISKTKQRGDITNEERQRTQKLGQEVIASDFDEFPKAHQKMLEHLTALADKYDEKVFPRDQIEPYMHFLTEQRDAAQEGRTGKMSDTVEDEEQQFDQPESGFSKTYSPIIGDVPKAVANAGRTRLNVEWANMSDKLEANGFWSSLDKFRNTGEPLSAHFLLNKAIEATDTPILRTLLTNIRSRVPDSPVYNRDNIIHMKTGAAIGGGRAAGVYHAQTNTIQFNFVPEEGFRPFQIRGLVHEMVHAGTISEMAINPHGQLAKDMNNALDVLRERLGNRYGKENIAAHVAYFNDRTGASPRPENYNRQLYGITNTHELATEILTNPEFIKEVAESENHKSQFESFGTFGKVGNLLTNIFKAIGNFFGIHDAKLLQHIVDTTFETMDAQRQSRPAIYGKHAMDFHNDLPAETHAALEGRPLEEALIHHAFNLIDEPPPRIRGVDDKIGEIIGHDNPAREALRETMHVFKSGAVDSIRKGVLALKTVGQLYRDYRRDFGHDDDTNPLRKVQSVDQEKDRIIGKLREISAPVAKAWQKLPREQDLAVSKLMIDTTMYKLDPRSKFEDQSLIARSGKGQEARHAEFTKRYEALSPEAREVYSSATDANRRLARAQRRAGVDTAIAALDVTLDDVQRGLLYGAKSPKAFDAIIGKGKLIDVGEHNDRLKSALGDFSGFTEQEGPYHHLGRQGDYVVSAKPEGTREFADKAAAEEFAANVKSLSPGSRGKVAERGGKWVVDYKAQHVSMHATRREAERARDALHNAGFATGLVTQKTLNSESTPISSAMKELVTSAQSKIERNGADEGTEAAVQSLRSAFLQITAARSAYAGSQLARKNFGGVKPEDMRRNFAEHALSAGWHTAQMQTVFEHADAMAKLRNLARENEGENQAQAYRRGEVVNMLNKHAAEEVRSYGQKAPFNAMLAKLGFMNYLASPSHAFIWMTQNFTTGIPVAGARWGYGKATAAWTRSMAAVTGPSMRSTVKAVFSRGGTSEDIHNAVLAAIEKHPTLGRWARGSDSALRQLIDRGVISHGYADELGTMAEGKSASVARVFEWARLMPAMADSFNRYSTALTALELTGGDINKAMDFVQEIHADYAARNKPLAFKKLRAIPGANSLVMFKTYAQEMIHLLYGNLIGTMKGENKLESAKTLAGLVVGNAMFAGVAGAIGLEPLRLAMYAYHKAMDDEGEVWDFKNAVHMWLVDHFGQKAGNALAGGPLMRAVGVDLSGRMGLADLFFHDPPDLLSADKDEWKNFIFNQSGPMVQEAANNVSGFMGKMQKGDMFGAISTVVPIKMYQDAVKAYELGTTGKRDSLGGQLTKPSAVDALIQLAGFKPADVALAQERQGARIEHSVAVKQAKDSMIKALVNAQGNNLETAKAWGRIDRFNRNNPTVPITGRDIRRMMNARAKTDAGVEGRDEKANEATRF